jgi:hypothetical protein
MRRIALTLIGALFVLTAGTASASAAPINVDAERREGGQPGVSVTVYAVVGGQQVPIQSIEAGLGSGEEEQNAGLCAEGVIHTSCTPADEASNK